MNNEVMEKKEGELIIVCSRCEKVLVIIKSIELGNTDLNFHILCNDCYKKLDKEEENFDEKWKLEFGMIEDEELSKLKE